MILHLVETAKAVGFDFVFSKYNRSTLVDGAKVTEGNLRFAKVIRANPKKVVLASQYTAGNAITHADGTIRQLPLFRKGASDRMKNDVPEMPEPP